MVRAVIGLFSALMSGLVVMGLAGAAPSEAFPEVDDTSFTEPNGDRTIQLSVVIPKAPEEVFTAFATAEGWKSWAAPYTSGDLRIGAVLETSYAPDAKPGDASTIHNQIVGWLPNALIILKNVKSPEGFPTPELFQQTVTIIELTPVAEGTRVRLSNAGFGSAEGFDKLFNDFRWGNAYSLHMLARRFAEGPIDWAAEAAKTEAANDKVGK